MMKKALRESRHLWVGNLPENVREEEIQEYFSRYGRVEKVKLLIKTSPDGAKAAFVDFVDIRSATKANEAQNRMGDRDLRTNFNEPGANKNHQYQRMHHGGYPGGGVDNYNYRQPPVVIYAAPPPNAVRGTYSPYQRNDSRYQQSYSSHPRDKRGRSPGSRGYRSSDSDRSPTPPRRRSIPSPDDSSDSDTSSKKDRCTVLVKYLPSRTSESNLEEALYLEFKRCGDILNIKIKGSGPERYAYIRFASKDQADRATDTSGRAFLGQDIKVSIKGRSKKENRAFELEFDPHATRTIFIGNLEKSLMHGELKDLFVKFGDVVYVDIKKMQTGVVTYAFIQYIDINSAMQAKRKMDRKYIGSQRIKVGYGRATPTNSLWIGNLPKDVMEHQVAKMFHSFGYVQRTLIDTHYWQALVRFETIESCTKAFAEMHGKPFMGKRLSVDFASPQCRDGFYGRMEKRGILDRRQLESSPTPPDVHVNFSNVVRGGAFQPRGFNVNRASLYQLEEQREYGGRDSGDGRPFDRYPDRPKSSFDYDQELRDYYGRDKRSRRDYSPMSRSTVSPQRRRYSRDSISPVSNKTHRKMKSKIEKKKKRRRSVDSSHSEEPVPKREKKKKKDKKVKKMKAGKGTIDLGYDIHEDDDASGPEIKSKSDLKKEKKERKKIEKAEKARKKAEKKQKKLEKLKTLQDKLSKIEAAVLESGNSDSKEMEEKKNDIEMQENNAIVKDEDKTIVKTEVEVNEQLINQAKKEVVTENEHSVQDHNDFANVNPEEVKVNETSKPKTPPFEAPIPLEKENGIKSNSKKLNKAGDSSDSSSSSSSESDDSDDSSDDDRDYKHRSHKEREAIARKETERRDTREPKAYRQDREPYRRERSPERQREKENNKINYSNPRRSPSIGYSSRRVTSPTGNKSSGRSKSPSPPARPRTRSRSPYPRRDNSYDRRRATSPKRSPRVFDKESQNSKSKSSRSPPPPPPPSDEKTPITNQTSEAGQNADTLLNLLRRFPVMWQGLLGLKNDTAAVQMHFLSGNIQLAENSLPRATPPEVPPPLRISQRMKLEASQLEGVDKRIQNPKEHCMLLALPCGRDPLDVHAQTRALKTGFITYLQQKQAAGIVNINYTEKPAAFVVHIFPPCEFAQAHVTRVGPDLLDSAAHSGHLMILITPA